MDSIGSYNSPSPPQPEIDSNATRYFPPQEGQSQHSDPSSGQTTPLSRADPEPSGGQHRYLPVLGIALVVGFLIMLGSFVAFSHSGGMAMPFNSPAMPQVRGDQPPWFAQPPSGPASAPFVAPVAPQQHLAPGGQDTPNTADLQDKQDAQAARGFFGAKWRNGGIQEGNQNPGKFWPLALIGLGIFFLVSRSRSRYRRYM